MAFNFVNLIFIWLLPLTASNMLTSGQNHNFSHVISSEGGNKLSPNQTTTQEALVLNPLSEVSGHNVTSIISIMGDVNHSEETTTKPGMKPSRQKTETMPSKTSLTNIQTAPTPTNSILPQLYSSTVGMKFITEVKFKVTTSATMVGTRQASNPTRRIPSVLRSSTQSQDKEKTLTTKITSDKIPHPSARPTWSTKPVPTATKSVENKSTIISPVTGGNATQSTGFNKTSLATTKTPFIQITKTKERQDPPENPKSENGTNYSKAVAGLIGGALVLMMAGFLVIYIKKLNLQRQQITTRNWAGPSPFLESGADNGQVTLRSSNQISLSSFLPQRLSKRLSLHPETDEELEDVAPGTTFGDKHQESIFGQEVNGNEVQESYPSS